MNDRAGDLLARAWPDGVPAVERAFLHLLDEARREVVLRRLDAVLAAEGGSTLTSGAGLGRTAFHKLRRDWKAHRSLRSLVPYARRPAPAPAFVEPAERTGTIAKSQVAEREAAVEAIRADPSADNGSLARRIAADLRSNFDPRTLVKLVRQERRLLHFKPTLLLGVYGRSLLADVSALELVIVGSDGSHRAIVAVVIERSSTLILGYAVGRREDGLQLQRRAAERATAALATWRADVPITNPVTLTLVVGPGPNRDVMDLAAHATSILGAGSVFFQGRRRFGKRAASLIGQPGRFAMKPSLTIPHGGSELTPPLVGPAVTIEEADVLVGAELERHNESALRALRTVGLAGKGEPSGAMAALIADVFRLGRL